MIERQGGVIWITCDSCPEAVDTGESDFTEAWAEAKSQGWRARKLDGEWLHSCPGCSEGE